MKFCVPIFNREKKIRLLLFQRSFHHRGTFFAIDRETILRVAREIGSGTRVGGGRGGGEGRENTLAS